MPLDAKDIRIDVSNAAERALTQKIAERRAELWLLENKAALDSSNDYAAKHGLPLSRFRQF